MKILTFLLASIVVSFGADIVPDSKKINWATNAGVRGGIPTRTTIFSTRSPGATLAQIQGDLDSCPANQVVKLNAGVYNLGGNLYIGKSSITLRGAGMGDPRTGVNGTILTNTSIWLCDPDRTYAPYDTFSLKGNITAGYTRGSTVITVSTVSGLSAGMVIGIDQLNAGQVFGGDEDSCGSCSRPTTAGPADGSRLMQQYVNIESISGSDITIWPAIYQTNYASGNDPEYWSWDQQITNSGIEELTIHRGNTSWNYLMSCGQNNWMLRCQSINASTFGLRTWGGRGYEVRECVFYYITNGTFGVYAIEPRWTSDLLVIDNVFERFPNGVKMESCSGAVIAYNYATNYIYNSPSTHLSQQIFTHGGFDNFVLTEGNHWANVQHDGTHSSGADYVDLRNRLTGWETTKTGGTVPYWIFNHQRNVYCVGNILGTDSYHNKFLVFNNGTDSEYVQQLGQNYLSGGSEDVYTNTFVYHGNYDVFNDSQTFTNSDHFITNSFLYGSKPAFFGFLRWPAFQPETITTGNYNEYESYTNIPAGYRWAFGTNPPAGAGGGGGGEAVTNRPSLRVLKIKTKK